MPKMFVHTRQGTFTPEARAQVASALTDLGIACERLPNTAKIRSGVWVFFTEHAPDAIFRAGEIAPDPVLLGPSGSRHFPPFSYARTKAG
jgi:hypothetical protein